jgi:long-chain acyl-CoA synthetase
MDTKTDKSLYDFMVNFSEAKSHNALTFYNVDVSFNVVLSEIDRVAGYLMSAGVKKGDSVCICLPNIPQAAITMYAVNKVGAISNMVHPLVSALGLKRKIQDGKSHIVFLAENLYHNYAEALEGLDLVQIVCSPADYLPAILKFGYNSKKKSSKYLECIKKYRPFDFKVLKGNGDKPYPEVLGKDIAAYLHSGGTTGDPKTIMLTNKNINELTAQMLESLDYAMHEGVALYAVLPMFHGFGLAICFHGAMSTRTRIVLIPQFNAEKAIKIIKKQKINMLIGVPQIYQKLVSTPNFHGNGLQSITSCFCGGDSLDINTKHNFEAILKSAGCNEVKILEGYGLTEVVTVSTVNTFTENKEGSVGKPICKTKVMIVDENKKPLPAGQKGQICVSGEVVMKGYLNDPKATSQTIFKDSEGVRWVLTGDMGYLDEDGFLFFLNRIKRIIIVSGINVFPSEIEKFACEVKGIKFSCAVEKCVGGKQTIALYVVLEKNVEFTPAFADKVFEHMRLNLDKWSQPRVIVPIEALPYTSIGKVDVEKLSKM